MARRINKSLLAMNKSYAVKRFKLVFREFKRLYPDLIENLTVKERRVKTGMAQQPLLQLEAIKQKGEMVMTNVGRNLDAAQEVYSAMRNVMANPKKFQQAIYGGRVFEYIEMAENAHRGDGIKAAALFDKLSPKQKEEFFKSSYYVPFVVEQNYENEAPESYREYIQREGQSPLITRLEDYVNDVANIAFDTQDSIDTEDLVVGRSLGYFEVQQAITRFMRGEEALPEEIGNMTMREILKMAAKGKK